MKSGKQTPPLNYRRFLALCRRFKRLVLRVAIFMSRSLSQRTREHVKSLQTKEIKSASNGLVRNKYIDSIVKKRDISSKKRESGIWGQKRYFPSNRQYRGFMLIQISCFAPGRSTVLRVVLAARRAARVSSRLRYDLRRHAASLERAQTNVLWPRVPSGRARQ